MNRPASAELRWPLGSAHWCAGPSAAQVTPSNWTTVDHKSRSPRRGSRRKPLINNELIFVGLGKGEGSEDLCPRVQSQQRFAGRRRKSMTAAQRKAVGLPMKRYRGSDRSTERCASPRLALRASFSSRNRSYLLTAILACRSVGRTIGNGGLVTTSLTQRASPPLK